MSIDVLLSRLDRVRQHGPQQWSACCPAHEDRSPSLSIRETDDGRVLIHCFAECGAERVLEALDLTFSDLYPELPAEHSRSSGRPRVDYRALLQIMAQETLLLRLTVADVLNEQIISIEHEQRLEVAQRRIEALWRHAHAT